MIVNKHEDRPVKVRVEWEHPEFATPDGKKTTSQVDNLEIKDPVSVSQFFWSFIDECKYELVPGKWTLRVFVNGRLAVKKVFDVQKPEKKEAAPSPAAAETATPSN
jgi:hypothetical protein